MKRKKRGRSIHPSTSKSTVPANELPGPLPAKQPAKRYNKNIKTANQLTQERKKELFDANEALRTEINKRKKTEEKFQTSQIRLADAMEMARIVYWELDVQPLQFIFNDAFYALYGTTAEAEGGYRMEPDEYARRFIHPDDIMIFTEIANSPASNIEREHRIIRRDGEIRHIIVRVRKFRDASGNFTKVYGANQDITERKKSEQSLRESREKLRKIFDCSADGIALMDLQGNILDCNQVLVKMHGYQSKDELIGKNFLTFVHPDDRQKSNNDYKAQIEKGEPTAHSEFRGIRQNGAVLFIEARASIIPDEEGKPQYIVSIVRDITEEKRREREKEVVNNINRILASNIEMRQGIHAVYTEMKKILDAERMSIALFDEAGEGFQYFALEKDYDAGELTRGITYSRKGSHFETVAETGLPLIIPDIGERNSWVAPKLLKEGVLSTLIFPLEYKGKIIGTINFGSSKPNNFSKVQFSLLQQIAPGLAIAIQNTFLFEKMKESEERYRTVVQSALEGICVIGGDYIFRYANESLTEIQGYPTGELIGRDFRDFLVEESKRLLADREDQRKRGIKLSPHSELTLLCKDGTARDTEVSARAIKDSQGGLNFIVFIKDVTDRKRAEKALRESEERFRLLVEHSPDTFILFDFDGKIIDINKHTCESSGYTREELLGMSIGDLDLDFIPGKHKEKWERMVPGVSTLIEGVNKNKDGTTYPAEIHLMHFESDGRKLLLGLGRDITERKRTEMLLKENQESLFQKNRQIEANSIQFQIALDELEGAYKELKDTQSKVLQQEKMASIGRIAAGVAHEINNPIAFISSNLGTLGKYFRRFTEYIQDQRKAIESLQAADKIEELKQKEKALKLDYIIEDTKGVITESLDGTERVQRIVQGLKSFARVDESDYKYANLNDCIESTLNIIWNELKYKATVKKEYGNLPLTKCYPQQMNQVFMNLLINAGHAIEKQGEITIRTWHEEKMIFATISDTGHGIPEENFDKIFEPFFTTKEVGKGTGLGLSITYDIIQKHHGEITVESKVGEGTTFTIKIPIV